MDAAGNILHNVCGDTPLPPASLTKIMTAYVALQAIEDGRLDLKDKIAIPKFARGLERHLGVTTITVEQALIAIFVFSANDAATALAIKIGGRQQNFVELMNKTARALGMLSTHFEDPTGLANANPNSKQRTTARDMATLILALTARFQKYNDLFTAPSLTLHGLPYPRHDGLLGVPDPYEGILAVKTGFTRFAGFNIAAAAIGKPVPKSYEASYSSTVAANDNVSSDMGCSHDNRVAAVVMGAPTADQRLQNVRNLLDRFASNRPQQTFPSTPALQKAAAG